MKVSNTVLAGAFLLASTLFASPATAASPATSVRDPQTQQQQRSRAWLGVTIQEVNERIARQMGISDPRGVLVADVAEGSPADDAGVNMGDVILRLNGRDVEDASDFIRRIQEAGVGSTVALEVNRAGAAEEINVTLEPMPPAAMLGSSKMGTTGGGWGRMSGMGMGPGMGMGGMAQGMGYDCPMGHPGAQQCPQGAMMGGQCPGYGQMMGGKGTTHGRMGMMGAMDGRMGMSGGAFYGKMMMAIKSMNLTPEQKARFDQLHSDYKKKAIRAGADIKIAHMELHELLSADPVNLDRVKAKVGELVQKKSDMMMLGIRGLEDLKKLLNPEQRKMLKDMLAMDSGMEDMEGEEALEGAE